MDIALKDLKLIRESLEYRIESLYGNPEQESKVARLETILDNIDTLIQRQ